MDLSPFKKDVDELIICFDEGNFKSLSDMKRIWIARKLSYIFDGTSESANSAFFMQSLYDNCVGHMVATYSLSHRLGGLYGLYLLYEIQPFKPPFKIYLSLGKLRRLKALVIDAKKEGIKVVSALVRRMIDGNVFLYGRVDMNDHESEMIKTCNLNAMLRMMQKKLFPDGGTELDQFLQMDMGAELNLFELQAVSTDYAEAKAHLLKELSKSGSIEDIKHMADDAPLIGDLLGKIVEEWDQEKAAFNQQIMSKEENIFQRKDYSGEIAPVQNLADESQLEEEESLPYSGFMQLLTAGDEEEDSLELGMDIERLLETEASEEEDFIDDIERILSED